MIKSKNELSVIRMLPSTFLQLMEKFLRVLFDFCCKTPLLKGMAFFLLAFITAAKIEAAPNVIFIVADDMGWHELNCYGNTFNETPNIDQLASDGIRFTNAYAAAAVCSPTRASIMTGQYSFRTGITDYIRAEANASNLILYPRDHVTYNERLNANNYHTTYIGKWHLSSHENNTGMPAQHGWNEVLGSETSAILGGDYWFPYGQISTLPNQTTANGYLTTRQFLITSNCLDRVYTQPFFIQLSLFAVHTELEAPQDLVDKYNNKRAQLGLPAVAYADRNSTPDRNPYLAAMIEVIDNGVGSIVTKLQQLGIADNTIIVFFSDNGGEHGADNNGVTDNGPLREGKRHAYEGGIREPLIIKWPGVVQAGRVSDVPVSSVDFYPTFVEMTGSTLSSEQYLDGKSIVPVLRNSGGIDRDFLIWSKPLAALHKNARSASAIRKGNFKLIEFHDTNTYELYNLANDLSETNNLAGSNPSKRDELANDLHRVIYGEPGSGFTENFNDNNDKGWVKYSGFWNVNNGVYELSSTFAKQKAMAAGTNFSDFTYEADIKLNTANAPGGLLFRTTLPIDGADGQRGYFVGLNTADGVRLVKYNFNSTQLTKTAMTINTGTWYHVKVVAQGSNIKIFVNDMNTPKINFNDSAWSFGAIGLRSYQCSVSYDNICVTAAGAVVDRTDAGGTVTAQYTNSPSGEEMDKAFDNSSTTKYLAVASSGWIQFQFAGGSTYAINSYALTSANDAPERDPYTWSLQGSNNGSAWTTLDSRTGEDFPNRFQRRVFSFNNNTAYNYLRLNMTNNSGSLLQIAEIEYFGDPGGTVATSTPTPTATPTPANTTANTASPTAVQQATATPTPVTGLTDITDLGGTVSAQYYDSPNGEEIDKLIDNATSTKYLTFHASGWVQYQTGTGYVVTGYGISSANDAAERDPYTWTFQGSNNGSSWTTLDSRSNEDFPNRFQTRSFSFSNSASYTYYRLNMTNNSGTILQLSEWEISGIAGTATATPIPQATPTPIAGSDIPGQIEAEDYSNMSGIQTESCSEGGLNVGWIEAGDWMDYNLNVTAGTYTVSYRVASLSSGGSLDLRIGNTTYNTVSFAATGGWQTWTTVTGTVTLPGGNQTIRIYSNQTGWNINWFNFN